MRLWGWKRGRPPFTTGRRPGAIGAVGKRELTLLGASGCVWGRRGTRGLGANDTSELQSSLGILCEGARAGAGVCCGDVLGPGCDTMRWAIWGRIRVG